MSPALSAGGWRVAPLVVVKEAGVAVEVGEVLGAEIAVVLNGLSRD
jgi:ethanolamine ammonia-lyase small subunit